MIKNLHDLFIHQIQELYFSTEVFLELYQDSREKCTDDELLKLLTEQETEVENQQRNLKSILTRHNQSAEVGQCAAAVGLKNSGLNLLNQTEGATKNAVIIASVQKIKHYEIALYGTAREYADLMGFESDSILLSDALEEKSVANDELTKLAVGSWFKAGANKASVEEA